jgi:phage tail tape-measure protein
MRFSMILEMVDRLSAPAKRARAGVGGLRASVRQMAAQVRGAARDVNNGTRSIEHFDRRARRLRQVALGRTFQAIGGSARKLGRDLDGLVRRLKLVERSGQMAGRGLKSLAGSAAGMLKNGLLAGGALAAGVGGFAVLDLFSTAGQFEQYQVQLEGIEGSATAARKAIRWVQEFTQKTPFELDQVMEGFVALKAYGIDPMNGSLTALGDASAGMSKPLMQGIEALADATTGEFERLKEFGIRASKEGNRVVFSYRKNGKDIRREAAFTGSAIEEALVGIMNDRFGGGMERQAQTMFGLISNLKDLWTSFLLLVAAAGIFDMVKKDLEGLLARVKELADSGELKRWAEEVSDRLEEAWKWGKDFVENTDWNAVAQDFRDIADAVGLIADGILEMKRAYDTVKGLGGIVNPLQNPVLRAGLRQITGGGAPSAGTPAATPRAPARLPSQSNPLRQFDRRSSLDLTGGLKIDVSSAPGLAVRATPVASPGTNLPMQVRTGRTMRSAA